MPPTASSAKVRKTESNTHASRSRKKRLATIPFDPVLHDNINVALDPPINLPPTNFDNVQLESIVEQDLPIRDNSNQDDGRVQNDEHRSKRQRQNSTFNLDTNVIVVSDSPIRDDLNQDDDRHHQSDEHRSKRQRQAGQWTGPRAHTEVIVIPDSLIQDSPIQDSLIQDSPIQNSPIRDNSNQDTDHHYPSDEHSSRRRSKRQRQDSTFDLETDVIVIPDSPIRDNSTLDTDHHQQSDKHRSKRLRQDPTFDLETDVIVIPDSPIRDNSTLDTDHHHQSDEHRSKRQRQDPTFGPDTEIVEHVLPRNADHARVQIIHEGDHNHTDEAGPPIADAEEYLDEPSVNVGFATEVRHGDPYETDAEVDSDDGMYPSYSDLDGIGRLLTDLPSCQEYARQMFRYGCQRFADPWRGYFYSCDPCRLAFGTYDDLSTHLHERHLLIPYPFCNCRICEVVYSSDLLAASRERRDLMQRWRDIVPDDCSIYRDALELSLLGLTTIDPLDLLMFIWDIESTTPMNF